MPALGQRMYPIGLRRLTTLVLLYRHLHFAQEPESRLVPLIGDERCVCVIVGPSRRSGVAAHV